MSANAHKLIIAILILLVAPFSSAHAAPNSGASAIYLVAPPPPPSPNSYPAALYTVGSPRNLLLFRQLFAPERVLYTPLPLAPTRRVARSLSTVFLLMRGRPS